MPLLLIYPSKPATRVIFRRIVLLTSPARFSMICRMDIPFCIPHRPPFLFVDRVLACDGETISAEKDWREEEFFYKGHYPGNPITPGVLLCESVFQAAALLMTERARLAGMAGGEAVPVLARIDGARFRRIVRPGQTCRIEVSHKETIKSFSFLTGKVSAEGKNVLNVDFSITMAAKGAEA